LRMTRLPMRWYCRPAGYPAWNPELRKVVRFWSAATRLDREVMENLQLRRFDSLPVVRPSDDQLRSQLAIEAVECRRHLRHVRDHYWEESWRREHRGFGIQPEDHLWRASEAVREIEDATTQMGRGRRGDLTRARSRSPPARPHAVCSARRSSAQHFRGGGAHDPGWCLPSP